MNCQHLRSCVSTQPDIFDRLEKLGWIEDCPSPYAWHFYKKHMRADYCWHTRQLTFWSARKSDMLYQSNKEFQSK